MRFRVVLQAQAVVLDLVLPTTTCTDTIDYCCCAVKNMALLRTISKILSTPIAVPGVIFILYGLGIDHTSILSPDTSMAVR